jgi:hypothetical protein
MGTTQQLISKIAVHLAIMNLKNMKMEESIFFIPI